MASGEGTFFFERQPKVKRSSCPRRRQCNSEAVVPLKHQHQRPLFPPPGPPLVLSTTMQLPLLTFIWLVKVCPEKKSLNLNVSRWMCVILRVPHPPLPVCQLQSPAFHRGSFSQAVSRCRLEQVQSSAPSVQWNYSPAHLPVSTAPYVNWDAAEQLEGSKCGTRRPGLLFRKPWISAVSVPAGTASIMSTPTPPLRRHPLTLHCRRRWISWPSSHKTEERKKERLYSGRTLPTRPTAAVCNNKLAVVWPSSL